MLPGDAAFGDAMRNLVEQGWDDLILKGVEQGKPFLGICMGLQLMFDESEEGGKHRGLGMLPGRIVKFPATERVGSLGLIWVHRMHSCNSFVSDWRQSHHMHSCNSFVWD